MLKSKSFLAVDCGAGTLKVAELEINEQGGLTLKNYGFKSLGVEGSQETARERVLTKALTDLIAERGFTAKSVNVCAPGYHVFTKFVKLPPVDTSKVTQIIQYEAQQNVPFPLAEVVWDYQILGAAASGELEVLLVAIKKEVIEGLSRVLEGQGVRMQLADVSAAALCNAFRYNYGDVSESVMLLDIGAKTSNLLFFEKDKVYARSINIGANSITQDFANESKIRFPEAEEIKVKDGFVGLGGAYEDPDNPNQAKISKIARQFMTRLHIQMNQTLQFWRGQQGGAAPTKLFLAGGASTMPYTSQFLAEKFNVPVEYFNPLRNVQIDPSVDVEALSHVAHAFGETIGLGLRNLAHCPVELNLMPESTVKAQAFKQKQPYFIATVFSLVAVVLAVGFLYQHLAELRNEEKDKVEAVLAPLRAKKNTFEKEQKNLKQARARSEKLAEVMESRYYWGDVLNELRRVLIIVEQKTKASLNADTGVWVEELLTTDRTTNSFVVGPVIPTVRMPSEPMPPGGGAPAPGPEVADPTIAGSQPDATAADVKTNQISRIFLRFRMVDRSQFKASANQDIAFATVAELRNSPFFDNNPTNTVLNSDLTRSVTDTNIFTFDVKVMLKRPLNL